jgi:predicted nucleic acid-binding protein
MRVVIDTNLLVSGFIFSGAPRQLLNAARAGVFDFCTSEVLLAELLEFIGRGKFAA